MAWMSWIRKSLGGVTWWPYALIGVVAVVGSVSGWAFMKGYSAAERNYLQQMNQALESQLKTFQTVTQKDLVIVTELVGEENDIDRTIDGIPVPVGAIGTDDWVRAYNDGVRGAAGYTRAAD